MDKIKKNWVYYFIIFIAFYIVPMLIKDTGSGIFILLIVIPLIMLITSFVYGLRNTFDFIYPLIVAILFIPTLFVYYNISAWSSLIDRLNPMYSKDSKFRDVYLLATASEEGDEVFEKAITGLSGWIDCFEKTSIKGTVLCGGVSSGGDIFSNTKLKEAYNLGSHV